MTTLDWFIHSAPEPSNAYVKEAGFSSLYVRKGPRFIEGKLVDQVLDLANFEARKKGKGTFTDLVARLNETYPSLTLYVESVLNPRLPRKLLELGFTKCKRPGEEDLAYDPAPCFYKLAPGKVIS